MNAKILAVIIVFVTNIRLCQSKRYDNYSLYRTVPLEKEHLKFLLNLESQNYINISFWKKPFKLFETVQIIVSPEDNEVFKERCTHYGLNVEALHSNVQELFDAQVSNRRYNPFQINSYTWDQFHSLQDIYEWMNDTANKYPLICELIPIGKSIENREIYALSIVRRNVKGTVIIEAGLHGNEWIATEFVTYLIHNLLSPEKSEDERLIGVAKEFHWFLIPVANPDGYEYSHAWDRLWRKNRRFDGNKTVGVDLNRNFDYSFCKFGASNQTTDDVYCGSKPFSEPETLALSRFIEDNSKNLKYYFSFHAYGQKIIIPYGDKILHVDNYADCENHGKQAIIKMFKQSGVKYSIGNSYDTLGHKISGNSASWVKEMFKVPFVYTFLLRDTGEYGYGMPPSEILPTCKETLTAVLEIMTTHVKRLRADIFSDTAAAGGVSTKLLWSAVAFWLAK